MLTEGLPESRSLACVSGRPVGYINQRLVLARRAADVAALLAEPAPASVITP